MDGLLGTLIFFLYYLLLGLNTSCYKMNKIAVFGLGKVGTLVGILLSDQFSVIGYDIHPPYYGIALPFEHKTLDIAKVDNIKHALENVDAVVSALPYFLNKHIAEIAHRKGVHYFDLTEENFTPQELVSFNKKIRIFIYE